MTQKQLAAYIDTAASRADMIDRTPATSKQCWFLAGLIIKANDSNDDGMINEFLTNSDYCLTKKEASRLIDSYLN